jgi:hypothetical protein
MRERMGCWQRMAVRLYSYALAFAHLRQICGASLPRFRGDLQGPASACYCRTLTQTWYEKLFSARVACERATRAHTLRTPPEFRL